MRGKDAGPEGGDAEQQPTERVPHTHDGEDDQQRPDVTGRVATDVVTMKTSLTYPGEDLATVGSTNAATYSVPSMTRYPKLSSRYPAKPENTDFGKLPQVHAGDSRQRQGKT